MIEKRIVPVLTLDPAGKLGRAIDLGGGPSDDPVTVASELVLAGATELLVDGNAVCSETLIARSGTLARTVAGRLTCQVEAAAIVEVEEILATGVGRVAVQKPALEDPNFIAEVARCCGPEALAVTISARREDDVWRVHGALDGPATEWDAITWARVVEAQGAAELIVDPVGGLTADAPNALRFLADLTDCVAMPIVLWGDLGSAEDCLDAMMIGNVDGVLVGPALFSGDRSLAVIREYLQEHGVSCA